MRHSRHIISAVLCLCGTLLLSASCNNASELPPLNEGYATEFILPDPTDLTSEERAYIQQLQDDYNASINSNQ